MVAAVGAGAAIRGQLRGQTEIRSLQAQHDG